MRNTSRSSAENLSWGRFSSFWDIARQSQGGGTFIQMCVYSAKYGKYNVIDYILAVSFLWWISAIPACVQNGPLDSFMFISDFTLLMYSGMKSGINTNFGSNFVIPYFTEWTHWAQGHKTSPSPCLIPMKLTMWHAEYFKIKCWKFELRSVQ